MRKEALTPKGEDTLLRLSNAARIAIKERGRDSFTTTDIAILAGVSIGTVYRYWRSRVEVLDDVWPGRSQEVPW